MANGENKGKAGYIGLRATEAEAARAQKIAEHYGIGVSSVIRMLLLREARKIGVEPAKTEG